MYLYEGKELFVRALIDEDKSFRITERVLQSFFTKLMELKRFRKTLRKALKIEWAPVEILMDDELQEAPNAKGAIVISENPELIEVPNEYELSLSCRSMVDVYLLTRLAVRLSERFKTLLVVDGRLLRTFWVTEASLSGTDETLCNVIDDWQGGVEGIAQRVWDLRLELTNGEPRICLLVTTALSAVVLERLDLLFGVKVIATPIIYPLLLKDSVYYLGPKLKGSEMLISVLNWKEGTPIPAQIVKLRRMLKGVLRWS